LPENAHYEGKIIGKIGVKFKFLSEMAIMKMQSFNWLQKKIIFVDKKNYLEYSE